jgi:hypothetical protein
MNISKRKLADLEGVYSTIIIELEGKQYLVGASENRDKMSLLFSPPNWEASLLWKEPSGVMNIIQVPGSNPRLLSITDFYPVFQSENAAVHEVYPRENFKEPWKINRILSVPFVHRIGLIECKGIPYLLCCSLCESKAFQDDWSKPGSLFVSTIPEKDRADDWQLKRIFHGLTKNHGLFIYNKNQVYVTAEEGIFFFDFSCYDFNKPIDPVHISKTPASDIFIDDIDDDGNLEIGTIEPFHGNVFALYRLAGDVLQPLYKSELNFGHVVWIGKLFGYPSAITANRGGGKEFILYQNKTKNIENTQWEKTVIDSGTGTTQISVFSGEGKYHIFAANHGIGEIALYTGTA